MPIPMHRSTKTAFTNLESWWHHWWHQHWHQLVFAFSTRNTDRTKLRRLQMSMSQPNKHWHRRRERPWTRRRYWRRGPFCCLLDIWGDFWGVFDCVSEIQSEILYPIHYPILYKYLTYIWLLVSGSGGFSVLACSISSLTCFQWLLDYLC